MTKKYLVTGGTGFLGCGLVKRLVSENACVRVIDNNSRGDLGRLSGVANEIEMVSADIRDAQAVRQACRGVDCVCHLAYVNGTEYFYSKPEIVLDVGVKGMVNVIDACLAEDVPELVLASSSEVYQTPPSVPTDESAPLLVPDPLNPRYSYGGGKIISELMAINWGRNNFERVLIFRPHNVYGPDMGWEHVIPQLALRVRDLCQHTNGTIRLPIQGTGQETRSFIYIDDMIEGIMQIIDSGNHLHIYHVGTDHEISIADLARTIGLVFDRQLEVVPGMLTAGSTQRRCPDISRLRALGFEPKVSLEDGVFRTVQWYNKNADRQPVQIRRDESYERKAA